MSHWDVVIVGGGIAGASLGAEIAAKRRTLIVEAEGHCGYHATGRSAAFWLESYGGAKVAQLTGASHGFLSEGGFLRTRGAVHVSREGWAELPQEVAVRRLERAELQQLVPGIRPAWRFAVLEPGCADIDVAALHAFYLRTFKISGGTVATAARLVGGRRLDSGWTIALEDGSSITAEIVVDAAGAWADPVAEACGVRPLGVAPKRRTMVQLRVGRAGLRELPLVDDAEGTFYFKGEGDRSIWLSPHDEIATEPCDAAPEEIDVATAIERFGQAVDWPVEAVERKWAGLRSFAPDRVPVYGFAPEQPRFFWCAGQGGFGIQSAPAAAKLAASLLLGDALDPMVGEVDPALFSPARFA